MRFAVRQTEYLAALPIDGTLKGVRCLEERFGFSEGGQLVTFPHDDTLFVTDDYELFRRTEQQLEPRAKGRDRKEALMICGLIVIVVVMIASTAWPWIHR